MGGPPSKSFLSEMQNIHRRKNLEAGVGPGVPPGGPLGVTPGVATSPPSANATSTLADQLRSRLEERRKSKEEEQQPQQHSVRRIKSVHIAHSHCAFSSNLFHGQISQIYIDHLSGPENKKCSP